MLGHRQSILDEENIIRSAATSYNRPFLSHFLIDQFSSICNSREENPLFMATPKSNERMKTDCTAGRRIYVAAVVFPGQFTT